MGDVGVDVKIILKWIIKREDVRMQTALMLLKTQNYKKMLKSISDIGICHSLCPVLLNSLNPAAL